MDRELPTAILFDLDDTIVCYDGVIGPIWDSVCANYSRQSGVDAKLLNDTIQEKSTWFWDDLERHRRARRNMRAARREVVKLAFAHLSLPEGDAMKVADAYSQRRREVLEVFPGATEALQQLEQRKVRMSLVSNGDAELQRHKLDKLKLARYFEVILLEGELEFGKPDERIFKLALEKMTLKPGDVWMVGDSLTFDISPAKELGIYTVWNDWRKKGLPSGSKVKPNRISCMIGFPATCTNCA